MKGASKNHNWVLGGTKDAKTGLTKVNAAPKFSIKELIQWHQQ
jgi:hypothetical protein